MERTEIHFSLEISDQIKEEGIDKVKKLMEESVEVPFEVKIEEDKSITLVEVKEKNESI